MWRNFWLSLSFANLVYLRSWSDLLPIDVEELYYRKTLPGINLYFAIAGDVLALSLLTFLLIRIAPRLPGWLKRLLLSLAVALVALAFASVAPRELHFGLFHVGIAGLWLAASALIFLFFPKAAGVARGAAFAATPCLAVTFLGSLFYLHAQTPLPPNPPLAQRLAGSPPVRVLWIIFDEWDQRLSFSNRAPGVALPTLDRLATRSFTATRALAVQEGTPLAEMATANAVPSLLYGKLLDKSEIEDAATRRILFHGGATTVFGSGDSIFARVHSRGWNAAAAGWYLPYCRVFAPEITDCYWDVMYEQRSSARASVPGAAIDETRMLFETRMFSIFGPSLMSVRHFEEYEALHAAALRYAADPSLGLAFIHFNIPHVPYFYDPKVGRFGHYGYSDDLYTAELPWLDRCVADILAAIHNAGLDSKTAVILSSDHPQRTSSEEDRYVPFIVHLPGDTIGAVSIEEFSTIKTAALVMDILRGEVKSASDIIAALGMAGPRLR